MLSPNTRSLYTAALNPPPGFEFDEAIGTTFSMDPAVLLSVHLHLALLRSPHSTAHQDGIAVVEAIRRRADRVTVYAQRARILVPPHPSEILGLLESMAVEVTAPRGGVFHPKLWLMRFVDADKAPMLRLIVLSRKLTNDQSWDLALTIEGTPGKSNIAANRELGELIAALPGMAFGKVDSTRRQQADRLAGEVRRTRWEPPPGFDEVAFHVLGRTGRAWSPEPFRRGAVISPFCAAGRRASWGTTGCWKIWCGHTAVGRLNSET